MTNQLIAVVGASADPQKYGHRIFRDLLKAGYRAVPVNPKGGTILDQPVFKSLTDLPQVPDVVLTVVPPEVTTTIVDQCLDLGVEEIWMQPGSESPNAFKKAQAEEVDIHQACFMKAHGLW
jgi:predicted CoA-binding protein